MKIKIRKRLLPGLLAPPVFKFLLSDRDFSFNINKKTIVFFSQFTKFQHYISLYSFLSAFVRFSSLLFLILLFIWRYLKLKTKSQNEIFVYIVVRMIGIWKQLGNISIKFSLIPALSDFCWFFKSAFLNFSFYLELSFG